MLIKNIKKAVLLSFISFSLFTLPVSAETSWNEVTWSEYSIKFDLPADAKEVNNDSEKYIAENDNLRFEIYPWKDSNVNEKDVAMAALEDINFDSGSLIITSKEKRNLNGYVGYEIMGEAQQDGKDLNFSVLGFIDPDSSVNFAAYILYWQGKRSNEDENIQIERDIIESIKKL